MCASVSDPNEEARWLTETVGVCARTDRAAVRVWGEEARSWLNGQITNDVRETARGDAVYALAVNVKGRILADLTVLDRGDDFVLLPPRDRREALLEHLDKYVVMEDVELEPIDEAVLTAQGPGAPKVADALDAPRYRTDHLGTSERPIGGFDVLVPPDRAEAALGALTEAAAAAGGGAVSEAGWELARVRLGRPRFGVDFGDAQLPQEAGLKALALSFDKGCYLGQEVVCMLEDRGQLRRRLVRLEGEALPPVGAGIEAEGKRVGEVTSALEDPADGRVRALGYVKRAFAEPGTTVSTDAGPLTVKGPVQ
jgi:folate-binding protein YgfZ